MSQVTREASALARGARAASAGRSALAAGPPRPRRRRASRALGFPTVRDEEWRFTNVAPIAATEFRTAPPAAVTAGDLATVPYADVPFRLVVVNGRFSAELSRLNGLPKGVRAGSLAAAVTETRRRRVALLRPAGRLQRPRVSSRSTPRWRPTARTSTSRTASCSSSRSRSSTSAAGGGAPEMSQARTLIVAGERSQARIVETYARGPTRARSTYVFHQRRDRGVRRRERDRGSLQGPAGKPRGVPRREPPRERTAQREFLVALVFARRQARPQRRERDARRRGGRSDAERPVSRRRRSAGRQPHRDRPRQGALPEPRGLQGHPRRQGPRDLQRQDHRPSGRAEDQREADQPRAAALGRSVDQHQAAARDLCRRREVHARRGDRAARRGRDLLPARPRA